jgi:predicted ester cyclase
MKIYLKISLLVLFLFLAGSRVQAQDDAKLKADISKVYEMFSSGDLTHLGEYIDENFVEHSPFPGQKPGLEGLKEAMGSLRKGYPDAKFVLNDIIVNSDNTKASVLFTFTGTNSGPMFGMKQTNKSVDVQGIDYLYFKNGKATEHWGYIDTDAMMKQLGMMPEGNMGNDKK